MRVLVGLAAFGLSVSVARADERAMVVSVAGQAGARWSEPYAPEATFGPRLTLSWETEPLALPAARGWVAGGSLVPELLGGGFIFENRVDGFIGAGLRAELKIAQRNMGLLRVTARSNAYVALRGLLVGPSRDPVVELAFGQNFIRWREWTRIGYEVAVLMPRQAWSCGECSYDTMTAAPAVMFLLYAAWAP